MSDPQARVAEQIARLGRAYRDSLPAQLDELNMLAAKFAAAGSDRTALEGLCQRLHKLAGSGGTFGLHQLSESARRLERLAGNWLGNAIIAVDARTRGAFKADVAALQATLAETEPARVASRPAAAADLAKASNRRIWLVDDDALLGREWSRHLGQFGYDVRLFTSVAEVEAASGGECPDVLVLDVMFPEEGIDSTAAIQHSPGLRKLDCPLLFVSSRDDFASRVRAVRAGAAGFLRKPLDVPRLVDRIERIFDERQAAPYRVMIVDDDTTLAEHYQLVLAGAGMVAEILGRPETLIERIATFRPELVLMDLHMPDYSGLELATVIRQHEEWIAMPIVFLSAETDFEQQTEALGRGADDFLTKPISDAQLAAAVRVRVSRSRQLADLMAKDSLTGLLKHSRIKEEVEIELSRARRSGKPMSVVMADIDHFKRVNDTYGHAAGDRVIQAVAHLFRQRLRKTDIIGRYGGEEFAIVLPDCDAATAYEIIDDIRQRFAAVRFSHDDAEFGCTLSAGICSSSGNSEAAGSDLLPAADAALYQAKNAGRNQTRIAGATQ